MRQSTVALLSASVALALLSGCKVGPNYKTPAAVMAPNIATFKEAPPAGFQGWKVGEPSDAKRRGAWGTASSAPQLNELDPQVATATQTLASADANFRAARAQIGYQRSFPA